MSIDTYVYYWRCVKLKEYDKRNMYNLFRHFLYNYAISLFLYYKCTFWFSYMKHLRENNPSSNILFSAKWKNSFFIFCVQGFSRSFIHLIYINPAQVTIRAWCQRCAIRVFKVRYLNILVCARVFCRLDTKHRNYTLEKYSSAYRCRFFRASKNSAIRIS